MFITISVSSAVSESTSKPHKVTDTHLIHVSSTCLPPPRYGMFGSVSAILKGELSVHLEAIMQRMMESLTSEDGVKVSYGGTVSGWGWHKMDMSGRGGGGGGRHKCLQQLGLKRFSDGCRQIVEILE